MHQQTQIYLQQLQAVMQELALWQVTPPEENAFLSEQPFALDTMSPTEWLQWIFIPRMRALIERGEMLPSKISITPYLEEALKDMADLDKLLHPISEIETLLQK
ncbi:MAG: YqcC family protein [Pasteurella oralis]|uniref:YqcC family protein n=1 Tax=Pasteurella oralis TaxID=1071947 RepID=UPI0027028F1A|nr:YqcC family protein [Pasteurella oralis]